MNTDFNERWDLKNGLVGLIASALIIGLVYFWETYDVKERYTEYWESKHQIETTK